jgi:hypothetical protein
MNLNEVFMKNMVRAGGIVLGDVVAIGLLYPDWGSLATGARDPQAWTTRQGADAVVSTLAAMALWLVAIWLGVGLLAVLAASLPGTAGAIGHAVADVAMPAVLRRTVAGALGLGILAAPVAALASPGPSPSGARSTVPATSTSTVAPPTWPSGAPARVPPTIAPPGWPTNARPRPPVEPTDVAPDRRPPGAPPESVVVRPGDSLWAITAARLGRRPTARQVAVTWPRWYAANRAEIGSDPNLIRPGQVLQAPHPAGGSR